ncbi:VOC family protein [Maritimibacter dapengensis]|uniref:VOC family protein n=1 Tax=Maritimibacter dapengensis TaxID=2836868 RepID=A0ABS6T6P7_9RHOB|nr:VOC family protein [Maritimibacter dapengensis]MBV7380201.1 VOC family protein [Maritimibacter dapengensis]
MEKVTGIGGFFFRAQDTKALAAWYRDTLGVNLVPEGPDDAPWIQEAGPTVFAPFSADTDYFGRDDQAFMLNFRVNDLDAMLAQLREADIDISREEEMEGVGRFARIHDPEGNPIELWEPAGG